VARTPLADQALAVLGPAPADPNVVLRYQVKIVTVPGSECLWWSGAVPGRGHGRFYVGNVADTDASADGAGQGERELCVIAHRFGYALVHGASGLNAVPVLGHGCDNPLGQRIGPDHAKPSSHALHRRAYLARRFVAGNPRWGMPGVPGAGPGSCVT